MKKNSKNRATFFEKNKKIDISRRKWEKMQDTNNSVLFFYRKNTTFTE